MHFNVYIFKYIYAYTWDYKLIAHKKGEIKSTKRTIQGGSYISNNNQLRGDCNHTEENRNNNETYESKLLDTITNMLQEKPLIL